MVGRSAGAGNCTVSPGTETSLTGRVIMSVAHIYDISK